ncbi:MAG: ATP synthase F1 subunit gamma [Candidatus Dojkabacteria bacterium]
MAHALDLKNRRRSTVNTGQITKALEMVSAARQKKAQEFLDNSRYLRIGICDLIHQISLDAIHLADQASRDTELRFFSRPESNRMLVITIMSQRGLCGSLNTGLFYHIAKLKRLHQDKEFEFISINKSAQRYLKNFNARIISCFDNIKENPDINDLYAIIAYVKDRAHEYDTVFLAYSDFIKSGVFEPRVTQLLPIRPQVPASDETSEPEKLAYTIEPDPVRVLASLANLYIDLALYEAALSSQAAEHSARMIAMKKASDNAHEMVQKLTLEMNKARQATITRQMAEIAASV